MALGAVRYSRRRRAGVGGLVLALGFLESPHPVDDVAVDGGAKGVFDGRADERDSSGLDRAAGLDEFVHETDGSRGPLLKHQGGVREGLVAELAQFVLEIVVFVEPAAEGALADVGLAGGGGDGAGGEQGLEGAFLAGSESVAEEVGVRSSHIFTVTGRWRGIWGCFC